jgi:hypothetical protein
MCYKQIHVAHSPAMVEIKWQKLKELKNLVSRILRAHHASSISGPPVSESRVSFLSDAHKIQELCDNLERARHVPFGKCAL